MNNIITSTHPLKKAFQSARGKFLQREQAAGPSASIKGARQQRRKNISNSLVAWGRSHLCPGPQFPHLYVNGVVGVGSP